MTNDDLHLPSFDSYLWPIIQVMKSDEQEQSRDQILTKVLSMPCADWDELEASDKKELHYRAQRAFDLLIVADLIEEKFGNLYTLTNGALILEESDANSLPRRVRTLDTYLSQGNEVPTVTESNKVIAKRTVRFLRGDNLNGLQLKEKLVKDFLARNEVGINMAAVDAFLDKTDYVKMVLEAEDILEVADDGHIELCQSPDQSDRLVEEHYSRNYVGEFIARRFNNLSERYKRKKGNRLRIRLTRRCVFDISTFLSVVGLSWLIVRRKGGSRKKK